jgi:hypothetical protein
MLKAAERLGARPHRISLRLCASAAKRIAVLALFLPLITLGQWQVNRQVGGGGGGPSQGSVRYSTPYSQSAYTSSNYTQRVDQSAGAMLPSQARYAAWSSGATPSELKMNYNRVGPMAPSGAMAYIPPSQNYRPQASSVATGNYVNRSASTYNPTPTYQPNYSPQRTMGPAPGPSAGAGTPSWTQPMQTGVASPNMGAVRYSAPAAPPPPSYLPNTLGIGPSQINSNNFASPANGSVRYAN